VATRFKAGRSLTSKNSSEIWIAVKEIYEDPSNPLTWPTLLMTDGDALFQGIAPNGSGRVGSGPNPTRQWPDPTRPDPRVSQIALRKN